jgi:hypothetical protein
LQIKQIVSFHTADAKPVKQEVNGTVIQPPLVFPDLPVLEFDPHRLYSRSTPVEPQGEAHSDPGRLGSLLFQ